jgi:small-conductance mechanosensitive channel/CRP-like cAMP-binding protein
VTHLTGNWLPVFVTLVVALTLRVVLVRLILPRFAALAGKVGRSYVRRVDAASLVIVGTLTAKTLFHLYGIDSSFTFGSLLLIGCSVYIVVETIKCFLVDYYVIHHLGKPVPRLLINVGEMALFAALFLSLGSTVTRINLTPFLATSAVLSAIIGLALQDTLGSLFTGLSLQADMPFRPGDWVEINGFLGQVVEVTWRSTKLRTRRNEMIVMPNNQVGKAVITNYSNPTAPTERNIVIGLGYDQQPNVVKERLMRAVAGVPGVLAKPVGDVRLIEFADSAVHYQVIYWITDFEGDMRIAARVRAAVWYACRRHGMEVPFPMRTVTLRQEAVQTPEDGRAVVDALTTVDFLRPLPIEDLIELASQMHRELWGAEEIVFGEGDAGTSLYIVMSGQLRVETLTTDGQPVLLGTVGPGAVVGEMSLLTGEPRTATVVCMEDSVLLSLDKSAVQPALEAHHDLLTEISRIVAMRQEANVTRLADTAVGGDGDGGHEARSQRLLGRIRQFFNLV